MKYVEIIKKYIGRTGDIRIGDDGNITFLTGLDRSRERSKILNVGDDYVFVDYIERGYSGSVHEEMYVHISKFTISDRH